MYVNAHNFSICLPSPSPTMSTSLFPKTKPQVLGMNNQWSMEANSTLIQMVAHPPHLIQSSLGIHGRLGPGHLSRYRFKILKSLIVYISIGSASGLRVLTVSCLFKKPWNKQTKPLYPKKKKASIKHSRNRTARQQKSYIWLAPNLSEFQTEESGRNIKRQLFMISSSD